MKKSLIFLFLLSLVLLSCNNETLNQEKDDKNETPKAEKSSKKADFEKQIVGKWKPDFEASVAKLTDAQRKSNKEDLESYKTVFEEMAFEYKSDGTYIQSLNNTAQMENVVCEITDKIIKIKENEKIYYQYEILELTASRMTLKLLSKDIDHFTDLVYKRVNKVVIYFISLIIALESCHQNFI
jgi:hypothetical protein